MEEIFTQADKEISSMLNKDERKEFLQLIQKLQKAIENDLEKYKD